MNLDCSSILSSSLPVYQVSQMDCPFCQDLTWPAVLYSSSVGRALAVQCGFESNPCNSFLIEKKALHIFVFEV